MGFTSFAFAEKMNESRISWTKRKGRVFIEDLRDMSLVKPNKNTEDEAYFEPLSARAENSRWRVFEASCRFDRWVTTHSV